MVTQVALTAEQAVAGSLARHSLLEGGSSVVETARDLVGLHNTTPSTPYLSLRARVGGFTRDQLEGPMYADWSMARFRAMRLTMFVFPVDILEIAAAAMRELAEAFAGRWMRDSDFSLKEFGRIADAVEEALADGPLTVRSLRQVLRLPSDVDLPGVVGRMCDTGRLIGGAPPTNWRSPVREFHRWRDVLPDVDLYRWDEADAAAELVHRYVAAYGPVTLDDISWWTGLTKSSCRNALAARPGVEEVGVEDWPGPLFRHSGERPAAMTERVSALPVLDPYVQGYRDRARLLDPARRDFVYDGGGNATATLLYRGRIIGVWQTVDGGRPEVRYHLFAGQPETIRRAAESELAAAGEMYFDRQVDVVAFPEMSSLRTDGGRSAMHPLDAVKHRAG